MSSRRYEMGLLALAGLAAALAASAHTVEARDDDLTMDFESQPWLHHGAVDFGSARMESYAYEDSSTVAIKWSSVTSPDAVASVQLVAPSLHAFGGPEPLASARAPIREGVNRYVLDPPSLAKGMYYVRVEVASAPPAVYLRPMPVARSTRATPGQTWARIGQQIELSRVSVRHDRPERLAITFDWTALEPIAANYAVSIRLQDETGRVWSSLDKQPGYGFLPTSAWLPGEIQHDAVALDVPADVPRDADYAVDAVWYRAASQQEIGRVRVPGIRIDALYAATDVSPPSRSFDVPLMQHRVDATFGDAIRLLGYDIAQDGGRLDLTLHWQALSDIGADYKFFVHVFDPATEQIVAQIDARPGGNAYPTSRWVKGEVVSETLAILIDEPGMYRVATGWYDPISADRLAAVDAQGQSLPANRMLLGEAMRAP